jgi:Xylanase inhibitor N-terminal
MMIVQECEPEKQERRSEEFSQHRRTNRIARWPGVVFLSVAFVNRAAQALTTESKPFLTFPLIPHREQQRRRRLEGYDDGVLRQQERPDHYPRRQLDAQQIAGLYHGYGTHYVDLWCGTPTPQRQTVIVDTGSGSTAFPCSACTNCGVPDYHIDALFEESQSTSFRALTCTECLKGSCNRASTKGGDCTIGMSYQEGSSWSAYEAVDTCYVGGLHSTVVTIPPNENTIDDLDPFDAPTFAFPLKFGCQTRLTGLFTTQLADGM